MSIKGWVGLVVTWLASLFACFKVGKVIEEKENEADESNARSDSISRGYISGNNAVEHFRSLHSDK